MSRMLPKHAVSELSDADLCAKAKTQGRGGEAEDILVARYVRMCLGEAKDYTPRGMDVGDLESEALLGLQRAVHSFDRRFGVTFRHFAKQIVRNALRDELRRGRRVAKRSVPFGLDDPLPSGEGGTITDLFGDPAAILYEETAPLRDVIARYAGTLANAYRAAARGEATSEPLRKALESSARALMGSGDLDRSDEMEAFVVSLGAKNGQMLLGDRDDEAAERAALALAQAHLAAAVRSAEGDETFRQAAAGLDPDAAIAAIRLVAQASRPVSEEA